MIRAVDEFSQSTSTTKHLRSVVFSFLPSDADFEQVEYFHELSSNLPKIIVCSLPRTQYDQEMYILQSRLLAKAYFLQQFKIAAAAQLSKYNDVTVDAAQPPVSADDVKQQMPAVVTPRAPVDNDDDVVNALYTTPDSSEEQHKSHDVSASAPLPDDMRLGRQTTVISGSSSVEFKCNIGDVIVGVCQASLRKQEADILVVTDRGKLNHTNIA